MAIGASTIRGLTSPTCRQASIRPFRAFPRDNRKLPTLSFISPSMCHSMHDCSIRTGDRWRKSTSTATPNGPLTTTAGWSSPSTRTPAARSTQRTIVGDHVRPGPRREDRPLHPCSAPSRTRTGWPRSALWPLRPHCRGSPRQPRSRPGLINGCQQLLDSSDVADLRAHADDRAELPHQPARDDAPASNASRPAGPRRCTSIGGAWDRP